MTPDQVPACPLLSQQFHIPEMALQSSHAGQAQTLEECLAGAAAPLTVMRPGVKSPSLTAGKLSSSIQSCIPSGICSLAWKLDS